MRREASDGLLNMLMVFQYLRTLNTFTVSHEKHSCLELCYNLQCIEVTYSECSMIS